MPGQTDRRQPVVTHAHQSAEVVHRVLRIPEDLTWFEGHFPGDPILPGIIQLKWVIESAQCMTGAGTQPGAIHQLKFKLPIRPGTIVDLTLRSVDGGATVKFSYRSEAGEHASGRLIYRMPLEERA